MIDFFVFLFVDEVMVYFRIFSLSDVLSLISQGSCPNVFFAKGVVFVGQSLQFHNTKSMALPLIYMVYDRQSSFVCTGNKSLSFVDRRQYDFLNLFGSQFFIDILVVAITLFELKQSCLLARCIVFIYAFLLNFAFCFIFQYIRQHIIKNYCFFNLLSSKLIILYLSKCFGFQNISQLSKFIKSIYNLTLILRIAMAQEQKQASSSTTTLLFIFSLLSLSASATLSVLLYLWGFMGFMGTPNLSITACTSSYHTVKYSNLTLINQAIFSASAIAAASGFIIFFVSLCLLIKKCSQDNKSNHHSSECNRNALYFFLCLSIMGSSIDVGYYLGYVIQSNYCTFTYDNNQLLVLLALGAGTLMFSLIQFFVVLCCLKTQTDRQEKYKQIQTKQTEPNEIQIVKNKQPKSYFTQGQQQLRPRFRERQETKQNIFQTPSKQPGQRIYERNQVYVNRNYNSDPNQLQMRFVPRYKQENPVFNMHPKLISDGVGQILSAKQQKYSPKRNILQNDQRYLREEQKRYLNEYNNRSPILHAQQKVYQQRDRDYRGRDSRNRRNDGYREREFRDNRDDDYDRQPRHIERNYNNQYQRGNRNQNYRDQYPRRRVQSPQRLGNRDERNYLGNRYY